MKMNRSKGVITGKAHLAWLLMLIVFVAVGCGGPKLVATNDPSSPLYRAQGVDFHSYDTAIIDLNDISTNNGQGDDEVRATSQQSLETWLKQSGIFKSVKNAGDAVEGKAVVVKAKVSVNWGSRAARALVGMGAGRATIAITYNVVDKETNKLVARMDVSDAMTGMSGQAWGGDAKQLVHQGTEKWNKVFINNVLQDRQQK